MKKRKHPIPLQERKLFVNGKNKIVKIINGKKLKQITSKEALRLLYLNKAKLIQARNSKELEQLKINISNLKLRQI